MTHPLIDAVFKELPQPGSVWLKPERAQWLNAVEAIINLVYQAPTNAATPAAKSDAPQVGKALTAAQENVLEALRIAGAMTNWVAMSFLELAQVSGVSQGTLPTTVEFLQGRNLIVVERDTARPNGKNRYKLIEGGTE